MVAVLLSGAPDKWFAQVRPFSRPVPFKAFVGLHSDQVRRDDMP